MGGGLERVFVVGMGEVGHRLAAALAASGCEIVPVTREAGWERAVGGEPGVRLVCVREERLAEVVERLAGLDGSSLVFVQNGWIGPLLAGLSGVTRGLIWFNSKGGAFRVLRPSLFCGPRAEELVAALALGGFAAAAEGEAAFRRHDAEKMGFNCVVGLPLAVHGVSLGEYLASRADEAEALFTESTTTCAAAVGARADPRWWRDFLAVAAPLASTRATVAKALEFRNGAVLRLARRARSPVPVTERLLAAAGYAG